MGLRWFTFDLTLSDWTFGIRIGCWGREIAITVLCFNLALDFDEAPWRRTR